MSEKQSSTVTGLPSDRDRAFMEEALALAGNCRPEDDRVPPSVGAVIVTRHGNRISAGYRGQHSAGNHAEQEALAHQSADVLRGAIVYTTLEPCTVRGKEPSCCQRLITAEVGEVVIGMLDPNRDIRGKGWWELESKGINVRYFASDIARKIRHLNRDFIEYQLGVGLLITKVQPTNSVECEVNHDHRARRIMLTVPGGMLILGGAYRVKPTRGDRIMLFVRRGNRYMPQHTINFDYERDKRFWQAPSAWVGIEDGINDNELIIARVSDDLQIALQHYSTVHSATNKWIGIVMDAEPPGFERLANLWVRVSQ